MKTLTFACLCSIALALSAFGQDPSPSVAITPPSPTPTASVGASPFGAVVGASVTPAAKASPDADGDSDFERRIEEKVKKHFRVNVDRDHHGIDNHFEPGAEMAIPIVGIIFTTLFGAPVMVVAVIMFMNYLKARSLHRTVRAMVERGQEVPAALFTSPPAQRRRSDMRRGIILVMVGLGLCIFLGAVNDWDSTWSLGIIPLLVGAGYLLVWKLEGGRDNGTPVA
jgi:hypothetical protein